ncbi:hypothetical protein HYQ46_006323 [Verticillium longisporum]|nr:hypothetical protein HYQ46_006323 [Verticillium longisporum]
MGSRPTQPYCCLSGSLRSSVWKAMVLGVYGWTMTLGLAGPLPPAMLAISHWPPVLTGLLLSDSTLSSSSSSSLSSSQREFLRCGCLSSSVGHMPQTAMPRLTRTTASMRTVTAKEALARRQDFSALWRPPAGAQERVMYQAMLEGRSGSAWSGPIWPYMEVVQRAARIMLKMSAMRG